MEIVKIKTSLLEANTGQVWGLPSNPRQWTKDELRRLAASLLETPELFEARPCLVYPHEGKYIVLGGNFRLAASKENKAKEVPCIVFPADTPVEKLKEIVIKDNGAFGSWDFDALANEWDDLPLADWGAPAWDFKEPTQKTTGEINLGALSEDDAAFNLQVLCDTPEKRNELMNELTERGYECKSI